jgi:hypothetical protein
MNLSKNSKASQAGATLVEMVAAVIILGIVVLGVAQYLLVSKINVYTNNIRTGVLQNLSDTIVEYQGMPVGETNVAVHEDLLPHVPSGRLRLEKSGPLNGTYTIRGSVTWRAFPRADSNGFNFNESLTLHIPE